MTIQEALQRFAEAVTAKMRLLTPGEPEDQLRGPFENLDGRPCYRAPRLEGQVQGRNPASRPAWVNLTSECMSTTCSLVMSNSKPPALAQTQCDSPATTEINGNDSSRCRTCSTVTGTNGRCTVTAKSWARRSASPGTSRLRAERQSVPTDAQALQHLLHDFLSWQPIIPKDRKGKIDLRRFAALLAPLCRMLRDDVTDALRDPSSPLVQLAKDWRQLLFPDATDEQFADAYAQTVAFALLLGRSEGADPLSLDTAEKALAAQHSLLSRALQVLTDPAAQTEMSASVDLLLRVIAVVPPAALIGPADPWLYFYEDFLAVYDPKLRKDVGAYYTPVEVVHAQVRLIDDLLVNRLGKPLGFADPGVITLDPAVGTGTYLLGVIEHALGKVEAEQGAGAVPGQASALAANLYGFELMVGPFAVTELRVSRALQDRGARLTKGDTHIYLTDTLESPHAQSPQVPLILKPIAEQHAKALSVKSSVPVIVCLGNPPYDRHEAVNPKAVEHLSKWGGWVRFGDPISEPDTLQKSTRPYALQEETAEPAKSA